MKKQKLQYVLPFTVGDDGEEFFAAEVSLIGFRFTNIVPCRRRSILLREDHFFFILLSGESKMEIAKDWRNIFEKS